MDYESALRDIRDMENQARTKIGQCRPCEVVKFWLFIDGCRDLRMMFSQRLKEAACATANR